MWLTKNVSDTILQLLLYIASFLGIWWGSGLIISSISRAAYAIKLPEFTISFFVLGLMTSLPEMSVAITSLNNGTPAISVGNLIGAVMVLLLLVIPLMGVTSGGIKIPRPAQKLSTILILLVCLMPTFFLRDRKLETWEGLVCIVAYILLFLSFSREQSVMERLKRNFTSKNKLQLFDGVKILVGVGLLFLCSNQIVESTIYFATILQIAPFFVSLVIVSLGTNIPEIALIFRSLVLRKPDIALADYLGSASANTLILGVISLFYKNTIEIPEHFFHRFLFMLIGVALFYVFVRVDNKISKFESLMLLLLYILFISLELLLV